MTFATFTNIVVILLCIAVLVQSVRLMRGIRAVQDGGLREMVEQLDKAAGQARIVLADLKKTLATEGAANARAVAQGEEIRDELSVMVGIANAVVERIVETAGASRPSDEKTEAKPKAAAKPKAEAKPQPEAKTDATPKRRARRAPAAAEAR